MRTICLDYDGTYTVFPGLCEMILEFCEKYEDITCLMVTMRYPTEKTGTLQYLEKRIPVYYTGRKAKKYALAERGIHVDVWLDDSPHLITEDAE